MYVLCRYCARDVGWTIVGGVQNARLAPANLESRVIITPAEIKFFEAAIAIRCGDTSGQRVCLFRGRSALSDQGIRTYLGTGR